MDTKEAEKPEVKQVEAQAPSNDKKDNSVKKLPQQDPQAPQQPKPESFTISAAGVDELVQALNEVVASKFVKQVLFNVINEHFKPVFKK